MKTYTIFTFMNGEWFPAAWKDAPSRRQAMKMFRNDPALADLIAGSSWRVE